jgi:hypothetical protein
MEGAPTPIGRKEDSTAWYATVKYDDSWAFAPRGKAPGDKIELVFPKSESFLRRLQWPEADRLSKRGWNIPKTLFIDVPFLFSFFFPRPAQVGSWIIDVQRREVYFKVVAFLKGYVGSANRIELEDTVHHEQDHLVENTLKGQEGGLPTNVKSGDDLAREWGHESGERLSTAEALLKKYGRDSVAKELQAAERELGIKLFQTPVLFSVVMESWLGSYCITHYEELRNLSQPMPKAMKGGSWAESWQKVKATASDLYARYVGVPLPDQIQKETFQ